MTATRPAPPMTEAAWQSRVVDYARLRGWTVYHTYNSRRSSPGFPDLVLARDRVVFAELKADRGRLAPAQRLWGAILGRAGAEYHLWRPADWDTVMAVLAHAEPPPCAIHETELAELRDRLDRIVSFLAVKRDFQGHNAAWAATVARIARDEDEERQT